MMIHLKDIPFLEDIPGSAMDNVFVRDIMTTPVIVLHHHESYVNIKRILQGCKHNGYERVVCCYYRHTHIGLLVLLGLLFFCDLLGF